MEIAWLIMARRAVSDNEARWLEAIEKATRRRETDGDLDRKGKET